MAAAWVPTLTSRVSWLTVAESYLGVSKQSGATLETQNDGALALRTRTKRSKLKETAISKIENKHHSQIVTQAVAGNMKITANVLTFEQEPVKYGAQYPFINSSVYLK